jgi:hypothetical protein
MGNGIPTYTHNGIPTGMNKRVMAGAGCGIAGMPGNGRDSGILHLNRGYGSRAGRIDLCLQLVKDEQAGEQENREFGHSRCYLLQK